MIIKYDLELNENGHPYMVEEKRYDYPEKNFCNPERIRDMLCSIFRMDRQAEERVYLVCLNAAMEAVGVFEVSHGTADMALVRGREVLIRALLCTGATRFIVAHNHPSGRINPSEEDKSVCERLTKAGGLIGIPMDDFIIIANNGYFSFSEEKMLG